MLIMNIDENTFWRTAYQCAVQANYMKMQGKVIQCVIPYSHYKVGLKSILDGRANLTKCSIRDKKQINSGTCHFVLDFDNKCSIRICAYNQN